MAVILTKPLIVPEYNTGRIALYTPDPTTGAPALNSAYTVNLQAIIDTLFPGQGRLARPNACKLHGVDLFVANSSSNSQAVFKLPGYLSNPATAIAHAFVFTLDGNDYVGLALDKLGNLYVVEGDFLNNQIVRYGGTNAAYPGAAGAVGNNYASKAVIGNAGATAYFGDLVLDAAGNLWAADYFNQRVVAFDAAGLGGANTWHAIGNTGALAVANTDPALNSPTAHLFAEPEGVDFDGFGPTANLWVANNNDGGGAGGVVNTATSLVKITKPLQDLILATANGGTVAAASIVANTNCFIYQVPNGPSGRPQFGGLQVDKAVGRLYVNEEIGGDGRAYDLSSIAAITATPAATLLAITSTNPGNGGIALLELGAYVADGNPDKGNEPDATGTLAYESLAISVVQTNLGAQATLPANANVTGGNSCFVYVQVDNFGPTATLGIETLDLLWAKGGTGLGWPKPWDGTVHDTSPHQTSLMGGGISNVALPQIPAFGSVVAGPFAWTAPNPANYNVQDGHFCLLARIVTPGLGNAGMSYPETGNLIGNVLNNARIGWRNIHIINPVTNKIQQRAGVLASNYSHETARVRLVFEVVDANGRPMRTPPGHVMITVNDKALEVLRHSSLGPLLRSHVARGEGDHEPVALPDLAAGIDGVRLARGEHLAFIADYVPHRSHHPVRGYALRVSQFVKESGGERLVGGQTFVYGEVDGLGISHHHRDRE